MRVFITGISSKIGVALAQELLRRGYEVWGAARTDNLIKNLFADQKYSRRLFFSKCDITGPEDIVRVEKEMMQEKFIPDAVVLGAALSENDMVPEFDYESLCRMHAVNYLGALKLVDVFLPHFKKQGHGVFVAIVSAQAFHPSATNAGYAASKAALRSAFRNLRIRYASEHIFFTSVHFGPILSGKDSAQNNFFVQNPDDVIPCIIAALSGRRADYYKPFFLKPFLVLSLLFPDRLVVAVLKFLRRM